VPAGIMQKKTKNA